VSAAHHPAAPAPGSHRYFTLLYTPAARREALSTLLVWLALAARRPHHRTPLLAGLTNNLIAWNAARRAARGRFRLQ
jgi:hypothetical protein